MSSTLLPLAISAGKSRRLRASETRRKLFEASQKVDPMVMVQTQLAMLTTSLDSLIAQMTMQHHNQSFGQVLNASAQPFVPAPPCILVDPPTAHGRDVGTASEPLAASANLKGSWEALDPWLLVDMDELCCIRSTCKQNWSLVKEFTPFDSLIAIRGCDFETSFQKNEDTATGHSSTSQETTDDDPVFSSEQMHTMIQELILIMVEEVSHSPRFQGASVDQMKAIAAEHKAAYLLGDGSMYSKVQGRELSVSICRSCIDAFVTPECHNRRPDSN